MTELAVQYAVVKGDDEAAVLHEALDIALGRWEEVEAKFV